MLDLMRRKKRLKGVLWVVIIGLGMGMLLFFVPGQNIGGGETSGVVATVNGDPITVKEYWDTYSRILKNFTRSNQSQLPPELLKQLGLDRQALNSLINVRVVSYAAKRLGLEVSNRELQRAVETNPNFQYQGAFIGVERYKSLLAANQLDVEQFEEGLRSALLTEKLQDVIADSLIAPEEDLRREFMREEQEAQVRFALLKKDDFEKRVKPAEAELRTYFDANKEKYATKEERRARYLLLSSSNFVPAMKVTDQEVEAQWAKEPHPEMAEASRILFAVPDPAKDAEVKAKAEAVLKRAKAGEDFTQLARKYSDDKATAKLGGNLGAFPRGRMTKELEDAAFSLKPGQISDLIRTKDGYEIIKALKREVPDLKSNWDSVVRAVQLEKATELVRQKSNEATQLVEKLKDLESIAKSLGVSAEIQETKFFSRQSDPATLGISESVVNEVFALKEINAIGKPVDVPTGYAIPQLAEIHLPKPGDFSQAHEAVTRDYASAKAIELLKAEAERLSAEAARTGDLEKTAKSMGLAVLNTKPFKRDSSPAPEISSSEGFNEAAFDLPVGAVSSPVDVKGRDEVAVLQVISRTPFDEAAYNKKKPEIRQRVTDQWRDAYFQAYIQRVADDLEKAGKIRVNTTVMNQVTGSSS